MLTDTVRRPTDAGRFALVGLASSLAVFGVLRLHWTELHLLLPLTHLQGVLAVRLLGAPTLPIDVTLACSGADALALCLGAVAAYPVAWERRVAGAGAGVALILALNTLRIGTLGRVAASPSWFAALHGYIWPAVLTVVIAAYVFTWMRIADRIGPDKHGHRPHPTMISAPSRESPAVHVQPSRQFVILTLILVVLFVAVSPLYLTSPAVLAIARFAASAAAAILGSVGIDASVAANVLITPRGSFLVTQECLATPLIPVYVAAVCAYASSWRGRVLGLAATLPLFVALGIVRLLVVALPAAIASPVFFVHAFYQLLLGTVIVCMAAWWRHGHSALGPALAGVLTGGAAAYLIGPALARLVTAVGGTALPDPQGALAFLPGFQIGLYLALWTAAFVALGWQRLLVGLAALSATQAGGLLLLHTLATSAGLTTHVRDIRGWAVAGPLLIVAVVVNVARPRR